VGITAGSREVPGRNACDRRHTYCIIIIIIIIMGHSVVPLVEALRYKPEGRGFDSLGSTQPLTKMRTRDILWGIKAAGA